MNSASGALRALAALAGVQTSYEDAFGKPHDASDEALAAILTALRFDVSSEERIVQSHAALANERLERGLEPVCVLYAGGPYEVALTVPRASANATFAWSLTAEDGSAVSGTATAQTPQERTPADMATEAAGAFERRSLPLAAAPSEGYYELAVTGGNRRYRSHVLVAPRACFVPEALERHGLWGIAAHVYALRSQRTRIAGDFTDLATFCSIVAAAGGSAVAVNPLHLLPGGARSPYGPSSRTYVNWAYLDVAELPGFEPADSQAPPSSERDLVDYDALYPQRYAGARRAFDRFRTGAGGDATRAFAAYVRAAGEGLRKAATFEALAEAYRRYPGADDWQRWPDELRDAGGAAVAAYAREHEDDIAFYSYLQWQCDEQLAGVARACAGMPIGLYRDLAVGTQLGGVDTWLSSESLVHDAATGAPPDILNPGQDWGVAPFDPIVLRREGYRPFIEMLRANARHAGALRIDHVMGLARLWWVPRGCSASDGAYVSYELDEMLAVLAIESHRAKCLIVGEDLGTVPAGFRERLETARVFSYRVLQFEHGDGGFVAPEHYPVDALAATGTHDLPTMTGYWNGADIALREQSSGGAGAQDFEADRAEREKKRGELRAAFAAAGVELAGDGAIAAAANLYLAKAPSRLLMLMLEDVLGITDQLNVPASSGYPNWMHRSPVLLEDLARDERFVALTRALRDAGRAFD